MKTPQQELIEKYKELIEHYKMFYDSVTSPQVVRLNNDLWNQHAAILESEFSALEQKAEEQSAKTVRDELIAFSRFKENCSPYSAIVNHEAYVDEYLSSKQTGK